MEPESISWFLSHPVQYFSPLLRELAKSARLHVFYYSDSSVKGGMDKGFGQAVKWDTDLLGGYDYQFINNRFKEKPLNNQLLDVFNPAVIHMVGNQKNGVVIVNGWSYSTDWMVMLTAWLKGKKVWLRAENPLNQELNKGRMKLWIKKFFLKSILFRLLVDKCLYIGTENKKFFEYYGVGGARLIYTPYTVDNQFFSSRARELAGTEQEIKEKLKLPPGKKIILFTGKYISKKNPLDLLRAFHMLGNPHYALIMVGEGELRPEMEQYIQANHLDNVYLTGFINQTEISAYYLLADVFVMCSGAGETWGLAVNEAMNFAKPVIVSDTCGCSKDLVTDGDNGFVFPEGNISALAECIRKVLENEAFRQAAGIRSAERIKSYSMERVVKNICAALPQSRQTA